jgi:hypothetical protein
MCVLLLSIDFTQKEFLVFKFTFEKYWEIFQQTFLFNGK